MIGHIFAKLYAITSDDILSCILEEEGHRAMGQASFYQDYHTIYHILVLRAIIEKAHSKYSKLFCFFMDFIKAFDIIPWHLLFDIFYLIVIYG